MSDTRTIPHSGVYVMVGIVLPKSGISACAITITEGKRIGPEHSNGAKYF